MIFQFYLVDIFLNNKFRWFGWEVVEYYSYSFRDRQNRDLMLRWEGVIKYSYLIKSMISGTLSAPCFLRKCLVTYPMWALLAMNKHTMVCVSSPR